MWQYSKAIQQIIDFDDITGEHTRTQSNWTNLEQSSGGVL